jgi:hypothetical protein
MLAARVSAGESLRALAREYHVSHEAIRRAVVMHHAARAS